MEGSLPEWAAKWTRSYGAILNSGFMRIEDDCVRAGLGQGLAVWAYNIDGETVIRTDLGSEVDVSFSFDRNWGQWIVWKCCWLHTGLCDVTLLYCLPGDRHCYHNMSLHRVQFGIQQNLGFLWCNQICTRYHAIYKQELEVASPAHLTFGQSPFSDWESEPCCKIKYKPAWILYIWMVYAG